MSFSPLPEKPDKLDLLNADSVLAFYQELEQITPAKAGLDNWLCQWSGLEARIDEGYGWMNIAASINTENTVAFDAIKNFREKVFPQIQQADQKLKEILVAYGKCPPEMELAVKGMKADMELFRQANLPRYAQLAQLELQHGQIEGAQSVKLDGKTLTMPQAGILLQEPDRKLRQRIWESMQQRLQTDSASLDHLFEQMLQLRHDMALEAGFKNHVPYAFAEKHRFS